MTTTVNIHEAKTHLSRLLDQVQKGERVIIAKAGKPIAELTLISKPDIVFGSMKGRFGDNYDAAFTPDADAEIDWNLDEPIDPNAR